MVIEDDTWQPTTEDIEDILSNNLDFDRGSLLFFSNFVAFGYSRKSSFIRGYTRWKARPDANLSKSTSSISCNVGLLSVSQLKENYQDALEELEKSRKENVNLSRELNALESKIQELNNDTMLKTVIDGHCQMKKKYGDEWDNSFLKLFTTFCFKYIAVEDNRGIRYGE